MLCLVVVVVVVVVEGGKERGKSFFWSRVERSEREFFRFSFFFFVQFAFSFAALTDPPFHSHRDKALNALSLSTLREKHLKKKRRNGEQEKNQ